MICTFFRYNLLENKNRLITDQSNSLFQFDERIMSSISHAKSNVIDSSNIDINYDFYENAFQTLHDNMAHFYFLLLTFI